MAPCPPPDPALDSLDRLGSHIEATFGPNCAALVRLLPICWACVMARPAFRDSAGLQGEADRRPMWQREALAQRVQPVPPNVSSVLPDVCLCVTCPAYFLTPPSSLAPSLPLLLLPPCHCPLPLSLSLALALALSLSLAAAVRPDQQCCHCKQGANGNAPNPPQHHIMHIATKGGGRCCDLV